MTSSSSSPHPGSHRKTSSQKQNISNTTSSSSSKNYYIRLSYANKNRSRFLLKKNSNSYPTSNCFALLIRRGVAAPPEVKTARCFLLCCWGWFVIVVLIKSILFNCFLFVVVFCLFPPFLLWSILWMSPLPVPTSKRSPLIPWCCTGIDRKVTIFFDAIILQVRQPGQLSLGRQLESWLFEIGILMTHGFYEIIPHIFG